MVLISQDFQAIDSKSISKLFLETFEQFFLIRAYNEKGDRFTLGSFDSETEAKEEYDRIFFSILSCSHDTIIDSDYHRMTVCEHCGSEDSTVKFRRQNTAFVDEKLNWVVLCDECHKENEEHWAEMWDDYYSPCL